jgi:hypothetical protein
MEGFSVSTANVQSSFQGIGSSFYDSINDIGIEGNQYEYEYTTKAAQKKKATQKKNAPLSKKAAPKKKKNIPSQPKLRMLDVVFPPCLILGAKNLHDRLFVLNWWANLGKPQQAEHKKKLEPLASFQGPDKNDPKVPNEKHGLEKIYLYKEQFSFNQNSSSGRRTWIMKRKIFFVSLVLHRSSIGFFLDNKNLC